MRKWSQGVKLAQSDIGKNEKYTDSYPNKSMNQEALSIRNF